MVFLVVYLVLAVLIAIAYGFMTSRWWRGARIGACWPLFVLIGFSQLSAEFRRAEADLLKDMGRKIAGKR